MGPCCFHQTSQTNPHLVGSFSQGDELNTSKPIALEWIRLVSPMSTDPDLQINSLNSSKHHGSDKYYQQQWTTMSQTCTCK